MALIPEPRTGPGTMSVEKCLNDGVEQGRITRAGAEKALAAVRRIMDENPGVGEGAAMSRAAKELEIQAAQQKRQIALQAIAVSRAVQDAETHPDGIAAGVRGIFARDISGKGQTFNVEGRAAAVRGILHGMMADALNAYRSKALGLRRDTLGLTRFVRELYGESTGDGTAAAAARGWTTATDYAVDRFNAAGGTLARKEAWRLPQSWDADAVKAKGRDAFVDYMERANAEGRLRIWDWEADAPVDPLRRAEIISQAYERITTNGLVDMVPGQGGSTKLANSRSQRRAFEWTTADAWLDFHRTYGTGDAGIFDTITGHIDGMAQDIAMLERLGPNPKAAARLLIDTAKKALATDDQAKTWGTKAKELFVDPMEQVQATWDHVSGQAASPVVEWRAKFFGGVRAWLSSAQLGSAVFSAVTDFSTLRATAAWNGLSRNGVMGEYLRLLNPANDGDRLLAVRAGLIADGWAQRARAAQRTMMEEIGQTLPSRMAGFIMRVTGNEAHTQAAKWAFGMEFLGHLADQSGKTFGALDAPLRRTMQRYGLDAGAWDLIRTRGILDDEGVRLVYPEQLVRGGSAAPPVDEAALRGRVAQAEAAYQASPAAVLDPEPYARFDEMVAALGEKERKPFQAHGTSLQGALSLLRDGIDPARDFHSGPLIPGKNGVDTTRTRNPVIFLSAPGQSVKETGIRYAVLQGPAEAIRDDLAASFPEVRFLTLDEAGAVIRRGVLPTPGVAGGTIDRTGQEVATRLLEMINTERGFAVIEPGAAEKAVVLGSTRAGSWSGEFWRASAQYKAFPVSMMARHMVRGMQAYRAGDHGRYMVGLTVSLTAMGALAMQLKEVAKGKDPRDMSDWKFWGAAFFQGGGAGILGDFLNSSLTRADRSFYMTAIGGPTAGLIDDFMKLTGANIAATAEGKNANFGRDMANFVRRNTPGSSIWYTRLALDRLMWDRVQQLADPEASRAFSRMESRAQQETGQRFWWGPGDAAPERAPAVGAALGAQP